MLMPVLIKAPKNMTVSPTSQYWMKINIKPPT